VDSPDWLLRFYTGISKLAGSFELTQLLLIAVHISGASCSQADLNHLADLRQTPFAIEESPGVLL
jgi:hypothetical protein